MSIEVSMQCTNPITTSGDIWPCGQCTPCRINKRREWTGRILLETQFNPASSFVTLTYADGFEPRTEDGEKSTLSKRHLQQFLNRFRKENGHFRYFACGEYGEKSTQRPHYHLILFGIPATPSWEERIRYAWSVPLDQSEGNHQHQFKINGKWRALIGWVSIAEVNQARAAYVASYTVKKLVKPKLKMVKMRDMKMRDQYLIKRVGKKKNSLISVPREFTETQWHKHNEAVKKLNGRDEEFAIMSTQPGIGACAIPWLAEQHMTPEGSKALLRNSDVLPEFRFGGKAFPIGKYLRQQLRERLNVPHLKTDRHALYGPPENKIDWAKFISNEFELGNVKTPGKSIETQIRVSQIPEIEAKLKKDFRQQAKIRNSQRI